MRLADIKIGKRLLGGFIIILALMVLIIAVGMTQLAKVGVTAQVMAEEELVMERLTNEWVANSKQNGIRTLAALKSTDRSMIEMYAQQIRETSDANKLIVRKLDEMVTNEKAKQLFDLSKEKQAAYNKIRESLFVLKEQGIDVEVIDQKIKTEFMPARTEYFDSMNAIANLERELINQAGAEIQNVKNTSSLILLSLGLVAIILGVVMAIKLSASITKPLSDALIVANAVANGDLTSEVHSSSSDEIGELLNSLKLMNHNLADIVGEVRQGSDKIAIASKEIALGNLDLSSRTEEQASSLEETASAMEQLTSTVKQNAENANLANGLAGSASNLASEGSHVIAEVIATMQIINQSSKRISDIISVVDGIAFQTNILALNAAVEAARAGEQGKGFAVVASEVRNLAQRSANAAKEIKSLINESVENVDQGSSQVVRAGETMNGIRESVERVTEMVNDIAHASFEQSTGIEQVNQAIMQMDEVTQQNAALVEEAAAASQSMQEQADLLNQSVSVFKV